MVSKQFQTPEGVPYQSWFQSSKISKKTYAEGSLFSDLFGISFKSSRLSRGQLSRLKHQRLTYVGMFVIMYESIELRLHFCRYVGVYVCIQFLVMYISMQCCYVAVLNSVKSES